VHSGKCRSHIPRRHVHAVAPVGRTEGAVPPTSAHVWAGADRRVLHSGIEASDGKRRQSARAVFGVEGTRQQTLFSASPRGRSPFFSGDAERVAVGHVEGR